MDWAEILANKRPPGNGGRFLYTLEIMGRFYRTALTVSLDSSPSTKAEWLTQDSAPASWN